MAAEEPLAKKVAVDVDLSQYDTIQVGKELDVEKWAAAINGS